MLVGFREGVKEGTYQGRHLMHIAQGLMFLETLVHQAQGQMEMVKREEKEMLKRAKEAIHEVGGQINGNENGPTA